MSKVTFCYGLSPYRCFGVSGSCLYETDGVKTDIFRRQPWQNVLNCPESHSGELGAKQSFLCFRTRQNAEYFKGHFRVQSSYLEFCVLGGGLLALARRTYSS